MSHRIPTTVRHEDFLAAVKPLLDLVGVTANEIATDIHITGATRGDVSLERISLTVFARKADDESDRPAGVHIADPPQEFAELGHHVVVEVV